MSCPKKWDKPCKDCKANHHTSLHGSTHIKIMAYRLNHTHSKEEIGSEEFGMLPMIHYTFEEVSQGTTIFFDEGSNASLITSKLVHSLYLTGKL